MLDKSVPYLNILMCRPAGTKNLHYELPEGFSFAMYQPGDEREWAKIETSVLEFPTSADALLKFQDHFMGLSGELPRRCLFIQNAEGEKIATATIWWEYSGKRRDPWVTYVAVRPEYQGKGVGRLLMTAIEEYIMSHIPNGWAVSLELISSKGREPFYERFGFEQRPCDWDGAGMFKMIRK